MGNSPEVHSASSSRTTRFFPEARYEIEASNDAITYVRLGSIWSSGNESFGKDPPDATVSVFSKDASLTKDAGVVLTSLVLDGDKLTFNVKVLKGDLAGADEPAAVIIDIIGLPFTPLSFADVARRTGARGGVFYSAAARPNPYPYPPPAPYPACGYYPYPPWY